MIFEEKTIVAGSRLASQTASVGSGLSSHDLKLVMLAAMADYPLEEQRLETMRKGLTLEYSGSQPLQWLIASLCELDRLSGEKHHPTTQIIDLMSHLQFFREEVPKGALMHCHGDSLLPLALHFAQIGAEAHFTGSKDLAATASRWLGKKLFVHEPDDHLVPEAHHFYIAPNTGPRLPSLFNNLFSAQYAGLTLLTTWSFLNTDNARMLALKHRLINGGDLKLALQLPQSVMPKMLAALLMFNPNRDNRKRVCLINAKDWSIATPDGRTELSYIMPILNLVDGISAPGRNHSRPGPPSEEATREDLLARNCDLRIPANRPQQIGKFRERLGDCCLLVRGQALPVCRPQDPPHRYCEVVLGDIDEYGLVRSASRVVENAPALTPARRLTLLKKNDILISFKGSVQSLARIGLVQETVPDRLPNQTFYVIRAETVDPIWLFHFLRSSCVLNYLRSRISGTSVTQLNIADLTSLPIPMPTAEQIERAHLHHAEILRLTRRMDRLKSQLETLAHDYDKLLCGEMNEPGRPEKDF